MESKSIGEGVATQAPNRSPSGAGDRRDIVDHEWTEQALRESEARLASELADAQLLQRISAQLIQEGDLGALYTEILDSAIALVRADMGSMQMLDPDKRALRLIAWNGFHPASASFWEWVGADKACSCGAALATAERVLVADIENGEFAVDAENLAHFRLSGIRAMQSTPLVSRDGRIVGMISTHWREPHHLSARDARLLDVLARQAADLIERKRTEEALCAANQVKDEFLSVASHELRTPLTSIMPNVQLTGRQLRALLDTITTMQEGSGQNAESLRQLEQRVRRPLQLIESTERQVKRLSRLVDDLLDVSRLQTGKLELRLERCNLLAIVRETVQEQRAAWPGRRITLDLPHHTSLVVHADADRIRQALANYLTNALKYSPEDQPVDVRVRMYGPCARVEARDHGPGLTEEQRQSLFERFYRVPGIEQQSGSGIGLGLGLYICQSLIKRHGGEVGVESAPGEGSTFWFTLPLLATGEAIGDGRSGKP